jgi:hypothetical protein
MGDRTGPTQAATFFCDESGNTGANWADPDQPIFVYAGWLVPDDAVAGIVSALDGLRAEYRIRGTELKWSAIGKRANGAAIFRTVFDLLLHNAAMPFFFVADKDYQTAAKIVETFFDPEYNDNLARGFSGAFEVKKRLAEMLLTAPSIRSEFADWHRRGDEPPAQDVVRLADQLRKHFAALGETDVASVLTGFTPRGIADIQREFAADVWLRTTTGHTLFALLQRLEGFLRINTIEVDIVHDELVRFDTLFDLMRELFREADGDDTHQVGASLVYTSMPTIKGLRLADSRSEPLIQTADLLAGFLRTVFTKLKHKKPLIADERAVVHDLAMIHQQWYTWDANIAEEMWATFVQAALLEG